MSSMSNLASQYAARIRAAANTPMAKLAKAVGAESDPPQDFINTITGVIGNVDNITYAETNRPLSTEGLESLCRMIDAELGVPHGSFLMVKKGSIKNLLTYQRLVMQLLTNITYS